MKSISTYIKDKRKNGFVTIRLLNYRVDIIMPPTNLKIWTRRMSWAHKMSWSIISFDLNLDGKVDSVGYFEMQDNLQFCVPIFENCEFYGKWHLQQGGTNFSSSLREEVYNLNAG